MSIRVTVEDTETGDTETQTIENDVLIITAGNRYVDGIQSYANGTQIFTVKVQP